MREKPSWDIRLCLLTAGYIVLGLGVLVWTAPFESAWPAILASPPILVLAFLILKEA